MEKETTVARKIRLLSSQARYDKACKRLLAEKIILAWILKSCVEEFQDCDVNEIAARYIVGTP